MFVKITSFQIAFAISDPAFYFSLSQLANKARRRASAFAKGYGATQVGRPAQGAASRLQTGLDEAREGRAVQAQREETPQSSFLARVDRLRPRS